MKKLFSLVAIIALTAILSQTSFAQNVTVNPGAGSYATLKAAFDAINAGTHTGTITVNIVNNTTETASAILNASGSGAANYTTVTISPSGGAARTITGAIVGHLVDLNGADNVTIDGLNSGGNSLTISNTSTGATSTIRFIADASNNVITRCTLTGSTTTSFGVVNFSTGTTTGNDGNNINNCNIGPAGSNLPLNGIYSLGSSSVIDNSSNTISTNNIFDYFNAASATSGMNINSFNSAWTITNNRLYQTATRIHTTGTTHSGINITSGENYTITGNIIGYANSSGTGTTNIVGNSVALTGTFPSSYSTTGTANATRYIAINCTFLVGGVASSIQNNLIAGFALYTSSGAATTNGIFCGIAINSGNANVGNTTGNSIGTATSSIYTACTTTGGTIVGIYASSTNTVNIQNNVIQNLDAMGTTATICGGITGINSAGTAGNFNILNNTIGNSTNPNLRMGNLTTGASLSNIGTTFGTASGTSTFTGILNAATGTVTIGSVASPNTIQNASQNSTAIGSSFRGINISGGTYTITGNTIRNLTSANTNTTVTTGLLGGVGILGQGGTAGSVITQNVIYTLSLTNTTTTGTNVAGVSLSNTSVDVTRNQIYDLRNASTSVTATTPGSASGVFIRSGTSLSNTRIFNNMISLGNGQATNTAFIGIWANHGSSPNPNDLIYYNSVNIEGTVTSGSMPSFGFHRGNFAITPVNLVTVDIRNNIFNNSRTGGTGKHYAIGNYWNATASATGWATNASNYNVLNSASSSTVGYWTTDRTFADWKTASASDASSISAAAVSFTNTATGDLHLTTCVSSQLESSAQVIAVIDDYDGNPRFPNAGFPTCSTWTPIAPDIGADEWGGNYLDVISPVISYTALGNIAPSGTRSFTDVTITDATGINVTAGTKPRCYFKKSTDDNAYTGNTPFNNGWKWVESNGTSSPFDFTINYGQLLGGSVNPGDVIQYFVTAQDLAGTPNIGINSGTFAGAPTSVADYANIFPLGGTINQYNISALYSGVYTVGSNLGDNFTTLTGAGGLFAALNAGVMSGNITAQITSDLTEDGANDLNTLSYDVAGANYTLRIVPSAATERVISGSSASGLIRFDGNDYVTIDGNNGLDAAGTKYLRFRNTNGLNPTISIQNDSRNNTITNCVIESNATGTLGAIGTIVVGSTTGPQGNDSLFITDCDIRDNSDASGTPITAVLASGNATYPNDYLTITGCNIYNTYNASATFVDLYIIAGNDNVTVSGNSIYQTSTRSPSNAAAYFAMIFASNGSINLSNNFLGGTSPSCGGTPTTFTDGGGYLGFRLFQTSTGVASTVSGNTIANIDYSTTVATSGFFFRAIDVNGNPTANVNVTGNTVGSQIGNDNIVLRYNPVAVTGSPVPCAIGFGFNSALTGYPLGSVTNNSIGGITLTGTGTTTGTAFSFTQIGIGSTVNTAVNVTGNTVGGSTANSIRNTLTSTVSVLMNGISSEAITNTTGVNISNNTVRNLTNNSTATTTNTLLRGIFHSGSAGLTCNSNTVNDLITTSGNTSGTSPSTASLVGILSTSTSLNQSVSQNTIFSLTNSNTGTGNVHAMGLAVNSSSSTGTVTRNRIYDISIPNTTGGSPAIMGINNWFGSWTISNNQITLTNDEATFDSKAKRNTSENSIKSLNNSFVRNNTHIQPHQNVKQTSVSDKNPTRNPLVSEGEIPQPENNDHEKQTDNNQLTYESDMSTSGVIVYGIFDDATTTQNYYYNSVYVGGSQNAGANNSAAFRKSTSSKVIYNNIFFNARTNGGTATGKHYAVISGNATINSNYNVYVSSNASTICLNGVTDQTIAQWRTSTAGLDNQTWSTTSSDINASNLFSNISAGILNINTANSEAWIVSGKGMAVSGQSTDFSGDARVVSVGSGVTDIGSDEIGALSMNTPTATVDNAPGSGVISTYTLWGRSIIRIAWGAGGSDYPTSLDVYYNSGIVPPNTLGGNFSFSHTIVNSNGPALTGATYDMTYYFGDNETYTIGTPGANTILAKYGISATWEVYHLVQPNSNSVLTYNTTSHTFNVAVAGLWDFSTFALTDDGAALPVTMESFNISVNSRDAILNWVTLSEINNKGFAIERRSKTETGYSQWKELGFVNGNGTTNERKQYMYKDAKLVIGAYQYRLRQVDYSNNVEYFLPTNNSDIIIGKPGVFDISQNYPNPSNPKSKIDFSMPFDGKVSIKVYDILGKEVASLINEFKPADFYTVEFDGSNVASGTYFYRIIAEGNNQKFTKTMKMILVK